MISDNNDFSLRKTVMVSGIALLLMAFAFWLILKGGKKPLVMADQTVTKQEVQK